MNEQEKNRVFQENLKKKLSYQDLVLLKSYFLYIFGKNMFQNVFLEFISQKRVILNFTIFLNILDLCLAF